jgi:hypothetical protein
MEGKGYPCIGPGGIKGDPNFFEVTARKANRRERQVFDDYFATTFEGD